MSDYQKLQANNKEAKEAIRNTLLTANQHTPKRTNLPESRSIQEIEEEIKNVKQILHRQLQESEAKYRELAENISEGIYLTENGYIKMVNTPACRLFGYEEDELIDKKVWDLVKPEKREAAKSLFSIKIAGQDGSPVDLECVRKDGSTFWGEISMRIIKDEKRVFGVISDVTLRKKAENKMRYSEQRLQMALKATHASLWDWDIKSGQVIFDQRWAEILGYNFEEIEPHIDAWRKIAHPEDQKDIEEKMSRHLAGQSSFFQSTYRISAKNGDWKHILSSGMVVERDADGKALRMVGTHQDMTGQKEVEQKLREINATKDKLFSIIAHDLKSPYNAQLGFLELLIEGEESFSADQRKKFIHTVYQSTKQSFALLDNLLMWSRTQTGQIPFNPVELLVAQLFEDAIDQQKFAAEAKNINIDIDLCNDNLEVTADCEMVNTILRNLLSNAIKFTHENGKIILGGKVAGHNKILLYVSDNGIGIPATDKELLFDAGNNYTTVGTNKEKGTGIGLLICKEFAERNGGKIWVESRPGKGSTFYFTLDSFRQTKKCEANCIQNFKLVIQKIKKDKELYQYFLDTIIPFFRHTYQKFSPKEITSFIDEMRRISDKHNIPEFASFTNMIAESMQTDNKNQINICFAEFEKLSDEIEIIASKGGN